VSEQVHWEAIQKHDRFQDGTVTYVFTHDIEGGQEDKPPVRMVTDDEKAQKSPPYASYYCIVCQSLGRGRHFDTKDGVVDHMRSV
jgi:hypothetical protein